MDYNREYTQILGQQIKRRFERASSIGGIDIKLVERDDGIHWIYKGVECHVYFYENGANPYNLYFSMKFPKEEGLVEKIKSSVSGNEIESSAFFKRPVREYSPKRKFESYIVRCPVKRKPKTKKQRDTMLGFAWGKIIAPMLGVATGVIKPK